MELEDQYVLKWFLKCCKIADDSLNFLAILTRGPFPPCPPLAMPLGETEVALKVQNGGLNRGVGMLL